MNINDENARFLIEKGKPYAGTTESIWDSQRDRVLWSASYRPELNRDLTLAEYQALKGVEYDARTYEDIRALDQAYEKTLITGPQEISEEEFFRALNELPPFRWSRHNGVEFFHICERIRGSLVAWYGMRGGKAYTFNDLAGRTNDEIAAKFNAVATYETIARACQRSDAVYKHA